MPSLRAFNPNVSRRTEKIILRAMAIDAERRFQSTAAMQQALAKRTVPRSSAPSVQRQKPWLQVIVGLFAIVVLGGGGYLGWDLFRDNVVPPIQSTATAPAPTAVVVATAIPESAQVETEATEILHPTQMPAPTDAVPAGQPTSTPTNTPTPTTTPIPQATPTFTLLPIIQPEPLAPSSSGEHPNPITFEWSGNLGYNQQYQVIAIHNSGYTLRSDPLTAQQWTTELPPEAFGEWKWRVAVLSGSREVTSSGEKVLWFNPMPGGGGGSGSDNNDDKGDAPGP
jgi:hypothetical protein